MKIYAKYFEKKDEFQQTEFSQKLRTIRGRKQKNPAGTNAPN